MEKLLEQTNSSMDTARWKQHSIYRVPEFIKDWTNSKAYQPQFVSLGSYRHGEQHLLPMEEHKRRVMLHMVKRSGKALWEFVAGINKVANEVEAAYDVVLDEKWRGANKSSFVEMMVTDGCFLLEVMRIHKILEDSKVDTGYAANDPIFSIRSYGNFWGFMRADMIAMENQVPLIILQRLLAVQRGKSPSAREINAMVQRVLNVHCFEDGMDSLGVHFLHIFHKSYCGTSPYRAQRWDRYETQMPCAAELREAGIQFKRSDTKSIHSIDFKNGMLSMPQLELYDNTEIALLKLMAFEWLHPDAEDDVASYVSFMDQIIESERDVSLLRSKGILVNLIGSDKMVVETFHTLTKLSRSWRDQRLGHLQWMLSDHCRKRHNKWRASFKSTYLSNPWVFFSLVVSFILLLATLLQTIYTVVLFYTKKG